MVEATVGSAIQPTRGNSDRRRCRQPCFDVEVLKVGNCQVLGVSSFLNHFAVRCVRYSGLLLLLFLLVAMPALLPVHVLLVLGIRSSSRANA